MATIQLTKDFREFLKSMNSEKVEYLLVGGYAVAWHGYPRATGDLDVWVAVSEENANRLVQALLKFGFDLPALRRELFLQPHKIIRMGRPPFRIEIITSASGCQFEGCRERAVEALLDDVPVAIIGLEDLKANKRAAGRHKDLDDLEHLP